MPDSSGLSLSGARVEAIAGKAMLANAVLHLFKDSLVADLTTPLSTYLEHECDFDGYAPRTIAVWSDPVLASAAYVVYAPTQTFPWNFDTDAVGNQVGGSFLVLTGGDQYQYTNFEPTRPCMGPDQAIITTASDVFPAG